MSLWLRLLVLTFLCGCSSRERIVVYCAHDREFADEILRHFEKSWGIQVVIRYDTEANKSVGLYEDLIREKDHPRCDVHWNNEILATIRLQNQGILAPYDSPAAAAFPEQYRAKDRTWTAFAARARVFLVNTKKLADAKHQPSRLKDMIDAKWRGQVAMARPFFGTTASHAACLFETMGNEKAVEFFLKLKENNIKLFPGNKQVAVAVGQGDVAFGLTDTDDAWGEHDAGRPVTIVYPDAATTSTLLIPNTVAIIRGGPNPAGARKLVDYLLSPEVEVKLANSKSRQKPLNPQALAQLPAEMKSLISVRAEAVDFDKAAQGWESTQEKLLDLFAK